MRFITAITTSALLIGSVTGSAIATPATSNVRVEAQQSECSQRQTKRYGQTLVSQLKQAMYYAEKVNKLDETRLRRLKRRNKTQEATLGASELVKETVKDYNDFSDAMGDYGHLTNRELEAYSLRSMRLTVDHLRKSKYVMGILIEDCGINELSDNRKEMQTLIDGYKKLIRDY